MFSGSNVTVFSYLRLKTKIGFNAYSKINKKCNAAGSLQTISNHLIPQQMKKLKKIFNVIILDESGSMQSIKGATISGFNEVFETIQQAEKEHDDQVHFVTFFSFNTNGINTHLFNQPASMLKPLTNASYHPSNGTPLYDAMGYGLNKQWETLENYEDTEVLVTILTDGEENASGEYDYRSIRSLIAELKKLGWTITYIGANHDVMAFSKHHGIDFALKYEANEKDMKEAFLKEKMARNAFYSNAGHNRGRDFFKDVPEDQEEKKEKDQK